MKSHRLLLVLVALIGMSASATSQGLTYGFRAGISFSKFIGDSEMDDAGNALDEFNFTSGFHIGFSMNYSVTDLFGFRGELLFSQRGTEYRYNGDSYYWLARQTTNDSKLVLGRRDVDQNLSQATLGVPIYAYYKVGWFEFSGGVYASVSIANTGGGSLDMTEVRSLMGNDVQDLAITLQHNYNKDRARQAGPLNTPIEIDGNTTLTSSNTGAYYDYDVKDKNMYNTFNFGLTAGVAFYLNDGLYLSTRVMYGLTDVDRNEYDISYYRLDDNNEYIQRADKNTDLTIQASIGFLF